MKKQNQAYRMLIAGEFVAGTATLPVVNPATEAVFAHVPDCTPAELDAAVDAARRAFPEWREVNPERRREVLLKVADRIEEHASSLAPLLTQEQGKPVASARREFESTLRFMRGLCALSLPDACNENTAQRLSVTRHVPLGVVAAVSPWNFPVLLSWWKVVPALLTGNTVVLKPSPSTPLTVLRIAELVADLLPPGVLNVVCGGDALGPRLTAHPGVDKITFTGSTATGKRVMESAAGSLKRITLELGGNDAAIVLPDADLSRAVPQLFWSAFANSGQVCIATKRLYVHRDIYDEVADAMVAFARDVKVGAGLDSDSQLGPLQNRQQLEQVRALVAQCRSEGLKVLFEGNVPEGPGYFHPVMLFDNPPECSRLVAEEPFGPVLPLLRYDTVDEAVARANASRYGLAGSVWSRDVDLAQQIAWRLETGTVFINEPYYLTPNAPFGGRKESGFGVENGTEGLLAFTEPQTVMIPRG